MVEMMNEMYIHAVNSLSAQNNLTIQSEGIASSVFLALRNLELYNDPKILTIHVKISKATTQTVPVVITISKALS